ncbi:MAG TPA: T9SS type A sorting domain-containing protein, partial [Saprospiraceae bacterium]|nr:T9SS type A sorting domain-containing protein [Saprospiraceae bacterium]
YASQDIQFPYEVDNVVNITGSTPPLNGEQPYYYFFNWAIEYVHPCGYKSIVIQTDGAGAVPEADFTVNSTELELPGNAELITQNQSTNADAFQWLFGDGTSSNEINPSHDYFIAGTYDVGLIARNSSGCTDASVVQIEVTGMVSNLENENAGNSVSLYPNPFNNQIVIEYGKNIPFGKGEIHVVNSLGQIVQKLNVQNAGGLQRINTNGWTSGVYWVEFRFDDVQQTFKMIKP